MKLYEIAHKTYHANIKQWTVRAKTLTVAKIREILQEESNREPKWFINKRQSRLRQLVSEIFTLTLEEVSDNTWSETDFEGQAHSDIISQSINDVLSLVEPIYHRLRTELVSANLVKQSGTQNKKEKSNYVEQNKAH